MKPKGYNTKFIGGPRDGESLQTEGFPPQTYELYGGPASEPGLAPNVHVYNLERTKLGGVEYKYEGLKPLRRL